MHQSIPPAPSPHAPLPPSWADPRALAFYLPWMANSQWWRPLDLSNLVEWGCKKRANPVGWGRKKRANATSCVNSATFFIDRTLEQCHFKHFNVRFFVSINVFLCNSARILTTR